MNKQKVLTKSGQVAPAYREPLREKLVADLVAQGWTIQPNGELTQDMFTHQGVVVRGVLNLSISTRTNFEPKGSKPVKKPTIDINELLKQG